MDWYKWITARNGLKYVVDVNQEYIDVTNSLLVKDIETKKQLWLISGRDLKFGDVAHLLREPLLRRYSEISLN